MYGDDAKGIALLKRCQQDARNNPARQARDRADLLNLKINRGGKDNHWLVWDSTSSSYVTRPESGEAGLPPWFFRATSNFFANKIDGISSILNQSQPAKNWYATRDDDKSRAAADVAELADPVLLDEIDYPHGLRPRLNKLVSLTNLAAVVLTYDTDPKWGMEGLQVLQCQSPACQQFVEPKDAPNEEDMCPDCGGPLDLAFFPPGHPQVGMPIEAEYPKGKLSAELLSSFEVSLPRSAAHAHEDYVPWLASHQRWATEDALSRWPKLKKKFDSKSASGGAKGVDQAYADQMRNMSSPVAGTTSVAGTAQGTGPVIWRLWHDPIDDDEFYFPQGVFLTALEGDEDPLEFDKLPFTDDDDRPFKNVMVRQFAPSPGSAFGKPPGDDMAPLQEQLNLAQALAFLILMHHSSPRTFIPTTVTMLTQMSGVPGKDVPYRSMVPGDKPHTEPGVGFPEGLKWFLEFLITTFDTISKLNAVLMGTKPQGDHTLGEVEILQERGFAAFQEPLEQLVSFERRLSMKLLWMTRQCGWSERYSRLVGENGQWKLQAFTGADLEGHVTLDIDLATAWPKSSMLTNLRVAKAFELGILNPMDPEVAEEYLRLNDLLDFKESTDADRDQVARQLDTWKQATDPAQIEQPELWWRLDYHLYRKTQFLKTEEFEQARVERPEVAQAMVAHVLQLQMLSAPPAADPNADPNAEPAKGAGGALEGAVKSGALRPKGGPGAGGALHAAVGSGAIRPGGTGAAVQAHQQQKKGPHIQDLIKAGAIRPAAGKPPARPAGGNPTSVAPTRPGASA